MNHKRPVNLDLGSMTFPPMAIVSILHRISGIVLFLLLPMVLYILSLSLRSVQSFDLLQTMLTRPTFKMLLWVFASAFIYHVIAGIRHLLMDIGVGEQLDISRQSAKIVIALAVIVTIFLGLWIW